jgi:hypothetical protein
MPIVQFGYQSPDPSVLWLTSVIWGAQILPRVRVPKAGAVWTALMIPVAIRGWPFAGWVSSVGLGLYDQRTGLV